MKEVMALRGVPEPGAEALQDVLHYYLTFSRPEQPRLAADPDPAKSPLKFEQTTLGRSPSSDPHERPILGQVSVVDLDQDGRLDVLACDIRDSAIIWLRRRGGLWEEVVLAEVPFPARVRVLENHQQSRLGLAVACLGALRPTDAPVGSVVLLTHDGSLRFTPKTILQDVGRVADVAPGDFDGDGDNDLVVAVYGHIRRGEIGWLENREGAYAYHPLLQRTGGLTVAPIDLNEDRRLDFVALFAQEHEQISAFLNEGQGGFRERVLFKAATPSFGLSGLRLVDLDRDGDTDILFTNGDNSDLPTMLPRPYHGVQWLENRGALEFGWHNLLRCYGPYDAVAADLNRDGHLDIVVAGMFNDWSDPRRASLLWLENDGRQGFRPHGIARQPIHLISIAVADLNDDQWTDIVACGMHGFPRFERLGRITWWNHLGPNK